MAKRVGESAKSRRQTGRASGRESGQERGLSRREPDSGITEAPMALFRRMKEEWDRLFDEFSMGRGGSVMPALRDLAPSGLREAATSAWGLWSPEVEVMERDDKMVVRADLPGLKKDEVTLTIDDDAIIIQGERRNEHEESGEGYYRSERRYGRFRRMIPLPEGIDAESAKASFRNGVLEITLDLPEGARTRGRQIEIKESGESETKPRAQAAGRGN